LLSDVIIPCPFCAKKYKLNADLLAFDQYGNRIEGKNLSCGNCNQKWWQSADIYYQNFAGIKNERTNERTSERTFTAKEPPQNFGRIDNYPENLASYSSDRRRPQNQQQSSVFLSRPVILWSGLLVVLVMVISLCGFYLSKSPAGVKYFEETYNKLHATISGLIRHNVKAGLIVQNINYTIQQSEGKNQVVVWGEVVNSNKAVAVIPPLQILVWGACPVPSPAQPNQAAPHPDRCVRLTWEYQWPNNQVMPGEKAVFQTLSHLEDGIQIQNVDVVVP
jgi:hypothetical protein